MQGTVMSRRAQARRQADEFAMEIAAEDRARAKQCPQAASLLAALDSAPWVDEAENRAQFAMRIEARHTANRSLRQQLDMGPGEVDAFRRLCGLSQ